MGRNDMAGVVKDQSASVEKVSITPFVGSSPISNTYDTVSIQQCTSLERRPMNYSQAMTYSKNLGYIANGTFAGGVS